MQGYEHVEAVIREQIHDLDPDVFIIEIVLTRGPKNVLSIWVDTDKGITIDKCARISRSMNEYFEEEDPFEFAFTVEVSSPGVGKPLKVRRQYHKNIGRKLKVRKDGDWVKGKLESVSEAGIVLIPARKKKSKKHPKGKSLGKKEEKPEIISLAFEDIEEAKVEISFD